MTGIYRFYQKHNAVTLNDVGRPLSFYPIFKHPGGPGLSEIKILILSNYPVL